MKSYIFPPDWKTQDCEEHLVRGREEYGGGGGLQRVTRKYHLRVINRFIIDSGDSFTDIYVCQKLIKFYCLNMCICIYQLYINKTIKMQRKISNSNKVKQPKPHT